MLKFEKPDLPESLEKREERDHANEVRKTQVGNYQTWEEKYEENPCDCDAGYRLIKTRNLPSDGWIALCACPNCKHLWLDFHEG